VYCSYVWLLFVAHVRMISEDPVCYWNMLTDSVTTEATESTSQQVDVAGDSSQPPFIEIFQLTRDADGARSTDRGSGHSSAEAIQVNLPLMKLEPDEDVGDRPFMCGVCKQKFAESGRLKEHMRIHTGSRPFICSSCQCTFSRCEHLKAHVCTHTDVKTHECNVCSRTFLSLSQLKRHMRIHSGERPYECSECKRRFTAGSDLKVHMRLHTGERPFICYVCQRKYTKSSHLKRHMNSHINEQQSA